MDILSYEEVSDILRNIDDSYFYERDSVYLAYAELMTEQINIPKTKNEQKALIETFSRDIVKGYSIEDIKMSYGDNKHMSYFDNFLEKGEANKIAEVLTENNLPTSILRGISLQDINQTAMHAGYPNVRIIQTVETIPPASRIVTSFEIIKDGEVIYSFGKDLIIDKKEVDNDDIDYDNINIVTKTVVGNRIIYNSSLYGILYNSIGRDGRNYYFIEDDEQLTGFRPISKNKFMEYID